MQERAAHTENLAVGVERDLGVPVLIAFLRGRDEMLAAILDPFDRLVERDRGHRDGGLFRIEHELRPKTAADIRRREAHRRLIASENVREQSGADQRCLCRAPQRQAAFDIGIGDHAAALDRMRAASVLLNRGFEDVPGCGEGSIDIAIRAGEFGKQIGAGVGMRARRVRFQRSMTVGNCGQWLIIDFDERRSVLGKIRRVGDDDGDGLAGIDGFVPGENRPIALLLVGAVRQRDRQQIGGHVACDIVGGQHGAHTGRRQRCFLGYGNDLGMGVRAPDEHRIQHAVDMNVVDEPAFAADQIGILDTRNAPANRLRRHAASSAASRSVKGFGR